MHDRCCGRERFDGRKGINTFGNAMLVSDEIAEKVGTIERKIADEGELVTVELSDREKKIIEGLGK